MRAFAGLLVLHLVAASGLAPAGEQPSLSAAEQRLQALQQERADLAQARARLESHRTALAQEVDDLQAGLADHAEAIRERETRLAGLRDQLARLEPELDAARASVRATDERRAALAAVLVRLAAQPADSLLLGAEPPIRTARAMTALEAALPALQAEFMALQEIVARQTRLGEETRAALDATEEVLAALAIERTELDRMLEARRALYSATRDEFAELTQEIALRAGEAAELEALVTELRRIPTPPTPPMRAPQREAARMPAPSTLPRASGSGMMLPAVGTLMRRYGEAGAAGEPERGVRLLTGPGALVTAPENGVVRFAGPFQNYGRILILEHDGGYHSVLAGVDRIEVELGQQVRRGEPVALMGSAPRPELYLEVRRAGRPINPAAVITDLKEVE